MDDETRRILETVLEAADALAAAQLAMRDEVGARLERIQALLSAIRDEMRGGAP